MDVAFAVRLDREDGLIGFHFHHFLALADLCAIFDQPADQGNFFNGLPQFGDKEFDSHQLTTFRQAAIIRPSFGIAWSSRISARGTGTFAAATRIIGASR